MSALTTPFIACTTLRIYPKYVTVETYRQIIVL